MECSEPAAAPAIIPFEACLVRQSPNPFDRYLWSLYWKPTDNRYHCELLEEINSDRINPAVSGELTVAFIVVVVIWTC
jgi:hypothetical protein